VELGKSNKQLDANDQGVVQVVDWLWQYAFDQRASDIHLEPRREQGVIRFRIDGGAAPGVPDAHGRAQCDDGPRQTAGPHGRGGKRRPQDGRIKTRNPRGEEIEMRISTLPTAFGEKMVMRIFDPDNAVKDLTRWAFPTMTRSAGRRWSSGPTASSWSPARPAPARPPRCIRR